MRTPVFLFFCLGISACFAQSVEDILKNANEHYENDDFRKAIHYLNEYIKSDSSNAEIYYKRGNCYFGLNNPTKAIDDYYQTIKLDSAFANAYYNTGAAYDNLENYDSAFAYYKKYVDLKPDDASGYVSLGQSILMIETIDSAKYYFKKAYSIDSTDLQSTLYLSRLYLIDNEFEKAIEYSNNGKKLNSAVSDFYITNSLSNYYLGNFEEAIIESDSALLLDSANIEAITINIKAKILKSTQPEKIYQNENFEFKFVNYNSDNLQETLNENRQFNSAEIKNKLENGEIVGLGQYFLYYISQQNQEGFSPYGFAASQEISTLWKNEEYEKLTEIGHTVFQKNPLNLHEIYQVAVANYITENLQDYEKYFAVYLGLMEGILATGTGENAESAFIVVSTSDEYALLYHQNLRSGGQALIHDNGHSYDVLTAIDESEETQKVYFNIDIPFGSLSKTFSDSDNDKKKKKKKDKKEK